jgi:glycosyltransferase involved in cell wall biosynthesis
VKVLIVSGIWPPDVGGPASHSPELAEFLRARGHGVEVVTTADAPPAPEPYLVHFVSRRTPTGLRHLAVAALVARRARAADVVYVTSMFGRAALGAFLARRPLVAKVVADPAYERARHLGLFSGSLAEFQEASGGIRIGVLRRARDLALRRARHAVCPSGYMKELAQGWGLAPDRVTVLPNPAPGVPPLPSHEELRAGRDLPLLAFAGRINRQKALEVLLAAMSQVEGVELVLAGEGPERERFEQETRRLGLDGRVRFVGALDRVGVLKLFRSADASILSSAWENFPHTVVEALAVGTPVISTAAGGVAEIVKDGENGLLVPVGDADALAAAIRRYLDDGALQARLRANAAASVEPLRRDSVYGRLERILAEA